MMANANRIEVIRFWSLVVSHQDGSIAMSHSSNFSFRPCRRGSIAAGKFAGRTGVIVAAACWMLLASTTLAETSEPEATKEKEPEVVKIAGVFEALSEGEVKIDHEHLASLEIKRLLPHGTEVKKGQNVIWLDTEEADEKIKKAELDLKLAELTLDEENFKYEQFIATQSLDKAAAQRARKQAQQRFDNYMGIDRDREALTAEFSLKSSQSALDNAAEELNQLKQMYEEDGLTEESEEIVLKRAKQAVEFAEFRLEGTQITSERSIEQTIPRKEASEKDAMERAEMAYQKSMKNLADARTRQDIEIAQKRDKFEEEKKKFEEMRDERKQMVLEAPIAGVLLHGKLTRGKLSDKPSTLDVGSKVTTDQVIMTVVNPAKLRVRVDLDEKHLGLVTPGTQCMVVPKPFSQLCLKGTVKSVSNVPYAGSKYDCVISFRQEKEDAMLMPMMGCDIEFEVAAETEENS